jgi:catechol 2,3-dioxygenase-like lactoylglutathione lyase family enzyme
VTTVPKELCGPRAVQQGQAAAALRGGVTAVSHRLGRRGHEHLGLTARNKLTTERAFHGIPTGPSASPQLDAVTFFWYPTAHARALYGGQWKGRTQYASNRGRVLDHVAVSVDNLDQTLARLRAEGVTVLIAPKTFVEAPDHMELEIVEGHASKVR